MYFIAEFCRICLRSEQPLEDIMGKSDKSKELLDKLELCVPEVCWTEHADLLLCTKCISNLNLVHDFKHQCCQSSKTFQNYLESLCIDESSAKKRKVTVQVNKDQVSADAVSEFLKYQASKAPKIAFAAPLIIKQQIFNQIQAKNLQNAAKPQPFVSVLPEQTKLLANAPRFIIPAAGNNSTFQNVFLNLVPMNIPRPTVPNAQNAERKPNVIIPNNNTFYMIYQNQQLHTNNVPRLHVPSLVRNAEIQQQQQQKLQTQSQVQQQPQIQVQPPKEVNVSKILTESQTEELSVELDPLDFDLSEDDDEQKETSEQKDNDWDDIISTNKITPVAEKNSKLQSLLDAPAKTTNNLHHQQNNIKPLVVKPWETCHPEPLPIQVSSADFFHSGHFLFPEDNPTTSLVKCEICGQQFETVKSLKYHIKMKHSGDFPYKCSDCNSEYALREHYDAHIQKFHVSSFDRDNSITLADLERDKNLMDLIPNNNVDEVVEEPIGKQFKCPECDMLFTTSQGLNRHKVRRHTNDPPKKYFIKGMKNALCKVCKRKFSTQSYLQIHMKQHVKRGEYVPKEGEEKYLEDKGKTTEDGSKLNENADVKDEGSSADKENNESRDDEAAESPCDEDDPSAVNCGDALEREVVEPSEELRAKVEEHDSEEEPEHSLLEPEVEVKIEEKNGEEESESKGLPKIPSLKIKINLREIKENERRKELENQREKKISDKRKERIDSYEDAQSDNDEMDEGLDEEEESHPADEEEGGNVADEDDVQMDEDSTAKDGKGMLGYLNRGDEGINVNEQELYEFNADEGSQEFQAPINLMDIELVEGKPQCSFCKKLFGRRHDLKRHINNVHLKFIVYSCHVCSRKFYEGFHLTRHLRGHFSFVTCATCLKPFCAIGELKNHMQTVHNGFGVFNCGICNELYYTLDSLREHMEVHDKSIVYQCHLCPAAFDECRELTKHLVEHSGMYTCLICQKPFASEQDLSLHVKSHESGLSEMPKRYECEICHNTYKKKRYLVIHQNNAHGISKKNTAEPTEKPECEALEDSS